MHVLNESKSWEYYDSLVDEREDSAVNVIRGAWLMHSSSIARLERIEPASPLDMLILYRAAAWTFRDWTPGSWPHEELAPGGPVINRAGAERKLRFIMDPELAALAIKFANRVIALSDEAAARQDLNYFVELFVHAVRDNQGIDGIVNGSISRHATKGSKQLHDFDFW